MNETLGMRISEYRKRKGYKQDELAEKLGVSAQAISKWENDVSCPDIMLLTSLADALGVSLDDLLRGKKESERAVLLSEEERSNPDLLMLVIRVNSSDGDTVRVNLPLPLVKVLVNAGVSIGDMGGDKVKGLNIDWAQIITLATSGVIGKLVEVKSKDGDTVEIVVE